MGALWAPDPMGFRELVEREMSQNVHSWTYEGSFLGQLARPEGRVA